MSQMDELRKFLQFMVDSRVTLKHDMRESKLDLAYVCLEDFVLQHGVEYTAISERNLAYKPGIPRYCFHNSYLAAVRSRGRLRYCEGYAMGSIMPVHHAWNVDEDDRVVDVTWRGDQLAGEYGHHVPPPADAYLGVAFPIELVKQTRMASTDGASVLDDWRQNWPILQTPWEESKWNARATASGRSR